MARFIPKQFAENSTTSVVFGSHQEQGGNPGDGTISSDPATLQGGAAWPLGWSAATDDFFQIPRGEEMEGLERVLSAAIIQQFKDGLTFWQSEMPVTQYQTIVQYQTGSDLPKLYINITGTSTSTPPDSDTTNWFMFLDTAKACANVALTNSPYTTNRILEIPQNIKLELSNGTLTLKAGSKVYDGNNNSFSITSDITKSGLVGGDVQQLLLLKIDGTTLLSVGVSDTNFAYNSSTGYVHSNTYGDYYLPIALTSHNTGTGAYTSIDQIFNGFGYIGSTVFVLSGVKVQIPNGRNEDGTCKNIIFSNDTVKTFTQGNVTRVEGTWLGPSGLGLSPLLYYDSENNVVIRSSDNATVQMAKLGECFLESGKITSFTPCSVDSVANSNASNFSQAGRSYLSGLGMPSSKYENWTLGATYATYTAPANGSFYVRKLSSAAGQYLAVYYLDSANNPIGRNEWSSGANQTLTCMITVQKRTVVHIDYNAGGTTNLFQFIYAEGEN